MKIFQTLLVALAALFVVGTISATPSTAPWFPKAPPLPEPSGKIIQVSSVEQLFAAVEKVSPGGTISLADGHYRMPGYLEITSDRVTLRSASGDRHRVVLDGSTSRHGELLGITGCKGVTIADLTIENIKWNGFKINSDLGAQQVRIYNCVIHNIWQRGIKAPAIPKGKPDSLAPRDCRIEFCLFYNDRPKRFSDDETDTAKTYNGNYIGGIDVKNTIDWMITDNVFLGIQGRTREGRGSIYISENGEGCVIERNLFIDCDIGIALGNPTLGNAPLQAIGCGARDNFVLNCPETGILACYTRDCEISHNTIRDAGNARQRLLWLQKSNDGLVLKDNLLFGSPIQITSLSAIEQSGNEIHLKMPSEVKGEAGQRNWTQAQIYEIVEWAEQRKSDEPAASGKLSTPATKLAPEVLIRMREVHADFKGQNGYVAQFGDSITYSMAFWSPMSWDDPGKYLTADDGLLKAPATAPWKNTIKGARDKGPEFANYSGWKIGDLLNSIDAVLAREKPETALIMIGTNDINDGEVPSDYRAGLEKVIAKCIAAHCVPILNTIPPRRDREKAVTEINTIIREVATEQIIPLADFHAECLRLRPGTTWDGSLISEDGVHPSGGKTNIYDEANLKACGYALRNWVNFRAFRQIYFGVYEKR
jgi:hypothetical protein